MRAYGVLTVAVLAVLPGRPASAQAFGRAVAVAGSDVFIGQPDDTRRAGLVYVYRPDAHGGWTEAARLAAADSARHDRFGAALAADGDWLLVGATAQADGRGAAYLFRRGGDGGWAQATRLTAPDGAADAGFGAAVALAGDLVLVGAPGRDSARGAVYAFRRAGDRWEAAGRLGAEDAQPNERFGWALATVDGRVAVGAPDREERAGAAYVFAAHEAGAWREEAQLTGSGTGRNSRFGAALAVVGGRLLVSAPTHEGFTGAVFAYQRDPQSGVWRESVVLRPFDGSRGMQFGAALAADGGDVWVGAPGAGRSAGRIYRYAWNGEAGEWSAVTKLAGPDAERGDALAGSLALTGDVAVAGAMRDDYGAGTAVVFERSRAGAWIPRAKVASETLVLPAIADGEVPCEDGTARGFPCRELNVLSFLPVQAIGGRRGVEVNDLWGWTDPETSKEYALVGRTDGTSFLDVSDPLRPIYLGDLPKTDSANGSTWRDIKVYRDHAFIVSDGAGPHGMQVFDLTQLRDVRTPPVTFREAAHYHGINSAHNIVINEATGFAFAVGASGGGETCGGGLHIVDIRDPRRPTFAGCFAHAETGRRGTGYTHDAQCVTYGGPDADHQGREICFGANETALSIADVTDKSQPRAIASASYPNVAYSHQGWLTEDQRYFYMDDEGDELSGTVPGTRTLIWDVADLDDPVLLGEYVSENRASDHNLYIRGTLMYQSNYVSGLRVLDISDPAKPVPVGYFDTVPWGEDAPGFDGSWSNYPFFESGIVVVTSGREGVFVLRRRPQNLMP